MYGYDVYGDNRTFSLHAGSMAVARGYVKAIKDRPNIVVHTIIKYSLNKKENAPKENKIIYQVLHDTLYKRRLSPDGK
jgi:hypothetical protein